MIVYTFDMTEVKVTGGKAQRYPTRIGRFLGVVALLVSAWPAIGQTFTRIADTQTAVPGGTGTFTVFADARAIGGGKVAFIGYDSALAPGIYSYQGGLLGIVADTHTTVPGTPDTFSDFFDVAIDGALVAFTGGWPGPGGGCSYSGNEGIFVRRFQASLIRAVATTLSTDKQCFEGVDLERGTIAVTGGVEPVDNYHNHAESVMTTKRTGQLRVILDTLTPKPGGGTFVGYDQDLSLRGGGFLFSEIIPNTFGALAGIYTLRKDGLGPQLVADGDTPVPGGSGDFTNFAGADWDGGEIAFVGRNSANQPFLYAGASPDDLRVVVDSSTIVPGETATFDGIGNPLAYEGGVIVFEGYWLGSKTGLFTSEGGVLQAILKQGAILDGRTVNDAFCRQGNKDGNQLLILVLFQDNTRGLYLVDL